MLAAAAATALVAAAGSDVAADSAAAAEVTPHFPDRLANGCFAVKELDRGRFLEFADGTYRAGPTTARDAERFWLEPTTLSFGYLLSDREGRLMAVTGDRVGARRRRPRTASGHSPRRSAAFRSRSTAAGWRSL